MKKPLLFLSLWLLMLQAQAQLLHESRYKPSPFQQNYIGASAPDGQGNVLYSATTIVGIGTFRHTLLLAKSDTDTLWTRRNPILFYTSYHALKALPGSNFIFVGNTKSANNMYALSIQKFNSNGLPVLSKNYAPTTSGAGSIVILPSNDYLMGGGYGTGTAYTFIRTDSLGNLKWAKDYKWSNNFDGLVDMAISANGNIMALGIVDEPFNEIHPKLLLINQNGDSLLGRQLIVGGFNRRERISSNENSVIALSDGGFLFTADIDTVSSAYPTGVIMGMVVKVDSGLNIVWRHIHRTPNVDGVIFTKSRELADGSVLVLGHRRYPASNGFSLFRFNLAGQLINEYPFTSNICNSLWAVTLDVVNDSTFMIGGGRCTNGANSDLYIATVKVPNLPTVLPIITAVKPELAAAHQPLGQSYPNPAQDYTIIPYTLPNSTRFAEILLTDITGREVDSYSLKANQKQGNLPVNLSKLSNGLYLYSLIVDGKPVATKKLAVAR